MWLASLFDGNDPAETGAVICPDKFFPKVGALRTVIGSASDWHSPADSSGEAPAHHVGSSGATQEPLACSVGFLHIINQSLSSAPGVAKTYKEHSTYPGWHGDCSCSNRRQPAPARAANSVEMGTELRDARLWSCVRRPPASSGSR